MYTYKELVLKYKDYSNPKTKISREVKKGNLIKVYKDFYVDNQTYSKYLVGCELISPSYISFFCALSYYCMIDDVTFSYTLAAASLKKHKTLTTSFGNYIYRDVPIKSFIEDVVYQNDGNYTFLIASKEKAIIDTLYSYYHKITSIKQIERILIEDMRLDMRTFYELDCIKMLNLSKLYTSTSIKYFIKFVEREMKNGKFNNR